MIIDEPQTIYFDNSATTRVNPVVAKAAYDTMVENYGNPSSMHKIGLNAEKALTKARRQIAKSLAVEPETIFFTSGGTESNNLAIQGVAKTYAKRGKHLITTCIEHPAVLNPCKMLAELGYEVDYLQVDKQGRINPLELKAKLRPDTILVSIMLVNNEIGSVQPLAEVAKILQEADHRIYFHVDGVQAYGKLELRPSKIGIDFLSASGHKIHAPKGVGFLYVAKGVRLLPLVGGGGQEKNLRSGTENLPGIVGFGLAGELACSDLANRCKRVEAVRMAFLQVLAENLTDWQINGSCEVAEFLPYVLNVSFSGVKSEVLLHSLEQLGLFVSSGSACAAKKDSLSPVLLNMGLGRERIEGALRFSFSGENTVEEGKKAGKIVVKAVKELREILK